MKAILLIISCLLASSVLLVPSSVLARELNAVEQADAPYRSIAGRGLPGSCGRGPRYSPCLPRKPPPPPSRSCGTYTRCRPP